MPSLGLSTDSEQPRGEIYLKGNSVFKGYFKNPAITKLVLDEDGWLRLGDAGILNPNGSISIIERIGEMKKLQNGYFIAPQKLENIYAGVPMINQIYVDVNSSYNFCVAIIHLDQEKLLQFADVNGLGKDKDSLINMQEVQYAVLKQCQRAASPSCFHPAASPPLVEIGAANWLPHQHEGHAAAKTTTTRRTAESNEEEYLRVILDHHQEC